MAWLVYPNPVSQGTTLKVKSSVAMPQGTVANIFSTTGNLLKANVPLYGEESSIDISGLIQGMYILQVVTPDGIKQTTNIVVN
jgi:hypothetical protein